MTSAAEKPDVLTQRTRTESAGAPARPATIVTRTGPTSDRPLTDPHKDANKQWSSAESLRLLEEYEARRKVFSTAQAVRIDQKQVAIQLVTLLLDPTGNIDDTAAAPNNGKNYQAGESDQLVAQYRAGESLPRLAKQSGRTQLGLGWKMLDHPTRPVAVLEVVKVRLRNG